MDLNLIFLWIPHFMLHRINDNLKHSNQLDIDLWFRLFIYPKTYNKKNLNALNFVAPRKYPGAPTQVRFLAFIWKAML